MLAVVQSLIAAASQWFGKFQLGVAQPKAHIVFAESEFDTRNTQKQKDSARAQYAEVMEKQYKFVSITCNPRSCCRCIGKYFLLQRSIYFSPSCAAAHLPLFFPSICQFSCAINANATVCLSVCECFFSFSSAIFRYFFAFHVANLQTTNWLHNQDLKLVENTHTYKWAERVQPLSCYCSFMLRKNRLVLFFLLPNARLIFWNSTPCLSPFRFLSSTST